MNLRLPKTTNIFRLGRETADKKRPLKVILPTKEESLKALKNRKIVKDDRSGIYMKNDQTEAQREFLKNVLTGLEKQKAQSKTNLIIKYLNGVPKIIEKAEKTKFVWGG